MPTSTRETLLAHYHYDPLDRLVDSTPFEQAAIRRYYCDTRLSTEIQGAVQHTIVQHDDQLLAQLQREGGKIAATLLATDQQRSVLNALDANPPKTLAYSPYGHRPQENGLLGLLGFNGERADPVTGHYPLGNGYRQFSPVLMRFNSPDSWSPFGEGGLNAYMYCGADPVNRSDPTGHFSLGSLIHILAQGINIAGITTTVVGLIIENEAVTLAGSAMIVVGVSVVLGGRLARMQPVNRSASLRPPSSYDSASNRLSPPHISRNSIMLPTNNHSNRQAMEMTRVNPRSYYIPRINNASLVPRARPPSGNGAVSSRQINATDIRQR